MNRIQRELIRIILAVTILAGCFCIEGGCQNNQIPDALIQAGTAAGVSTYLQQGIRDPQRRTDIANIGSGIAGSLRTVTTNPPPTPDQLSQVIISNLSDHIKTDYPEVVAFMVPLVVQGYQFALQHYDGQNQQMAYQILNDLATGVENGCAPFIHHQ